eukprot:6410332-Amphidinium_carterae.1
MRSQERPQQLLVFIVADRMISWPMWPGMGMLNSASPHGVSWQACSFKMILSKFMLRRALR